MGDRLREGEKGRGCIGIALSRGSARQENIWAKENGRARVVSTERNADGQLQSVSFSQGPGGQRTLERKMRNCKGKCSARPSGTGSSAPSSCQELRRGDVLGTSKGENGKNFLKGTHGVLWGQNHGLKKTVSAALRPKLHEDTLWPSPHSQHSCFLQIPQRKCAAHWKTKQSSLCNYRVPGPGLQK